MKLIKLAILITAAMFSVVACDNTTNSNQTAGTNTTTPPAASPTAAPNIPAPTPADEFAALRPVYAEHCARCHKIDGEGGTAEVLGKKLKVPSLKRGHALNHSDAELAKKIAEGDDGMPAFKDRLDEEQINSLVRFIRKEFQSGIKDEKQKPAPKS
jgi:mono/diheme cytochrome c family protein